jgi:hypothetical protein
MFPIFVEDPSTWQRVRVPDTIVKECSEIIKFNSYNVKSIEELRLIDCYYHRMGYYGKPPILSVFE